MEVAAQFEERRLAFGRDAGDDVARFGGQHAADGGDARLDDAGFFTGDQGQGVSELLGVVEADRGDNGDGWPADVGGIQAAAESHFEHHRVALCLGEAEERDRGHDVEERGTAARDARGFGFAIERFDGAAHSFREQPEFVERAWLAVDGDAFGDRFQVGRGVEGRAEPGGAKDRGRHGGRRPFALGARDMDDSQAVLGIAEPPHQGSHRLQLEFAGRRRRRSLVVDTAEEKIQRLVRFARRIHIAAGFPACQEPLRFLQASKPHFIVAVSVFRYSRACSSREIPFPARPRTVRGSAAYRRRSSSATPGVRA